MGEEEHGVRRRVVRGEVRGVRTGREIEVRTRLGRGGEGVLEARAGQTLVGVEGGVALVALRRARGGLVVPW